MAFLENVHAIFFMVLAGLNKQYKKFQSDSNILVSRKASHGSHY